MSVDSTPWRKTRAGKWWWREIPNPCAVQHVYNSAFSGGIRFTYLAIALQMPARYLQTPPLYLDALMRWTRYTDNQTRDHLETLEGAGEIARHRPTPKSKLVSYEMCKLAGPLPFWANPNPEETSGSTETESRRDFGIPGNRIPKRLRDPVTATRTSVHISPTTPQQQEEIEHFRTWWRTEFPRHNHGALSIPKSAIVAELLADGRSVERLRAMALLTWTIQADGDPSSSRSFIARSDRSIHVVKHKADWLDLEVARAASRQPAEPAWQPCGRCNTAGFIEDEAGMRRCACWLERFAHAG